MMKLGLIGGNELKKYTIADVLWKNISEISGVKFTFEIYELSDKNELEDFFETYNSDNDFIGFNVATPWKAESSNIGSPLVGDICAKNGIINTVFKKNGSILTANTDPLGIIKSYLRRNKTLPKEVLIIGSGNAGRSLALRLNSEGCNVYMYDIKKITPIFENIYPLNSYSEMVNKKYDWIINASTVGKYYTDRAVEAFSSPVSSIDIQKISNPKCVYQEMNYLPVKTELLRVGEQLNFDVISGVEMLVYQGISSFELYTGKKLPEDIITKLVESMSSYSENVEKTILARNTQ